MTTNTHNCPHCDGLLNMYREETCTAEFWQDDDGTFWHSRDTELEQGKSWLVCDNHECSKAYTVEYKSGDLEVNFP